MGKLSLTLLFFFLSSGLNAEDFILHLTGNATTYIGYRQSIDPSVAPANSIQVSGSDIPSQRALVSSLPVKYLKIESNLVTEKTQGEKDSADAEEIATIIAQAKATAKALQDSLDAQERLIRAVVKQTVDELNILRQWLESFKTEVASSSNLADFKARVGTLPSTPDRTYGQAKSAVDSLIDSE